MMSSDDLTEGDGVSTIDEKSKVRLIKFLEKKPKLTMYEKFKFIVTWNTDWKTHKWNTRRA